MKSAKASPAFWKNKSVFLTGHTGFKGGWLSLWLRSMGSQVSGFSKDPEYRPNFFELLNLASKMKSDLRADINESQKLTDSLKESNAEIVFHLAAQPLVRKSYQEPIQTYMDNVMGTISLLEAVRKCPSVKAVIIITTDKCYENREWAWPYREDEALGGYDPYSSSKACAEIATAAWRRSFFQGTEKNVKVVTARAGNVIGGGDWSEDRLIPDAIRSISKNTTLMIRNPRAIRPWQHVLDPLNGYLLLAEKTYGTEAHAHSFNFGPSDDDSVSVQTVLELFQSYWGPDFKWIAELNPANPHEAALLKLDSSRAKSQLAWSPRWILSESLKHTVDWYKTALAQPEKLETVSLKQLELFLS